MAINIDKVFNSVDVNIQDQTTQLVQTRLSQQQGLYELSIATVINDHTIVVTDATDLSIGDIILIAENGTISKSQFFLIKSIATNTLTVNAPIDVIFTTSAVVLKVTVNMGVDGSSTSQIFSLYNGGNIPIDITRIILKMITTTAPDLGKFGDLDTLTNGLVLRKKMIDGTYHTISVWRNNSEIALSTYDLTIYEAAKHGVYGVAGRMSFAGMDKHGVVIRLEQHESLEAVIQDDISDLIDFKIMAEGHYTDEV